MIHCCRLSGVAVVLLISWGLLLGASLAAASTNQFELSDAVEVNEVDNATLAQLRRVKTLLADRQWDEAIEILRQLAESSEGKLLAVGPRRYVELREACQSHLAAMPPEALKLYRGRVDPTARRWYERGIARRDPRSLQKVVDQALASSYGDRALVALGEMSLEAGDFAAARWNWERAAANSQWPVASDSNASGPQSPSPKPSPEILARLVLVSILEGDFARAEGELAAFAERYPDAKGRLGHREGSYAELLRTFLDESKGSGFGVQGLDGAREWPTFAGNAARNRIGPPLADVGAVAWRLPLRVEARPPGPFDPLSFHPVLTGGVALVNDERRILAVRCDTGQPAWGKNAAIYQSELAGVDGGPASVGDALGSPRFTMTVVGERLYARMGSAITGRPRETTLVGQPGHLVCLDLAAQGRLLWRAAPGDGWAFEGSPLADQRGVYVAMRRQDVRPQSYVACFEPETGRLRWRRFICGAETPARGIFAEYTHNLLTLAGGTIYYNTNLGAVASLRADDGRILWVSLYPRQLRGELGQLSPHWRRDLNPCVVDRGVVLAAPADSPRVFAFDAPTGRLLWRSGAEVADAVSLLGTSGDWLIAGGSRLYWIGLGGENRGRVKHVWPEAATEGPGLGRGVLAGQDVLWPTRDKLYVFDAPSARLRKIVDLAARGVTGGNVLAADGRLLIAGPSELTALRPENVGPSRREITITSCPNTTTCKQSKN